MFNLEAEPLTFEIGSKGGELTQGTTIISEYNATWNATCLRSRRRATILVPSTLTFQQESSVVNGRSTKRGVGSRNV